MLATSDAVLSAWLSPARQLRGRIKVKDTMYESEEFTSLSFDSGSISGETYQIGSTYMNTVKVVFPSILEEVAEDVEIVPEIAVFVDDEYHYTKLGHFYVTEFDRDRNANTTTLTASDKMIYMEGPYASRLTFPKSYREVALEIANLAGVEVDENSFATLQNLSIAKPEGYTHRQAIGLIAQFEGGFASFNREGKLEIRRLRPTEFGVTPESYLLKGFRKNENAYRIGGITVRIGDEESATLHVGSTNGSQVMLENKVMTQTLLDLMWVQVKDLIYFPFDLKWRGCPALEAGDWMYVTDRNGTRYSVPNLSYSINFNGGMSAESKATTDSSSQATYKYRGPLSQKIDYIDNLLSSNGWNQNYYDATEPTNPKEGDIWFKPNGQDTEIWIYEKDADGNLSWVLQVSTAPDPELIQAIDDVGKEVEQAQSDSATALENANNAVNKANEASAKADQSQQTADQAKSDATNAAGKAQSALDSAGQAVSSATDALNQANLAKSQAEEAINKYLGMGMVPAWSWSPDGTDRFTTVEPGENLFNNEAPFFDPAQWIVEEPGLYLRTGTNPACSTFDIPNILEKAYPGRDFTGENMAISFEIEPLVEGVQFTATDMYINNQLSVPYNRPTLTVGKKSKVYASFVYKKGTAGTAFMHIYFNTLPTKAIRLSKFKLEINDSATIYTPAPSEDYTNAVPSYIGFAIEPSDNPADYTWIRNPDKVEGEVKVELTDINGELSRKVSQETFDQLNGMVINHSTLISQNQNEIKQKASQESVNTLTGRVTTAEGSISTIAGQVALKANQTDVDTIAGRVTSAESQLTVQAGKITGLTSVTDGHTSKIGALELQAGQFSLSLSSVQNDLNSLEIGGRNYWRLSNPQINLSSWTWDKTENTFIYNSTNTSVGSFYISNIMNYSFPDDSGVGKTMTVSLDVISNKDGLQFSNANLYINNNLLVQHNRPILVVGERVRIRATFVYVKPTSGTQLMHFYVTVPGGLSAGDITICNLKLEVGNKATDWSPAPEDMATVTSLTEVKATVDSLTMTVADKADKTTVTQLANQWQQTTSLVNGHTSQISSLGDAINLRVEKDDIINQINISPESILIAGQKVHITGQTTIDSAVIKTAHIADAAITNAKIGSLSADKVTVGTLNGADVNIINLNASNIVSGEISGINIRAATFYGTSTSGTMQLNGTDLRFDTTTNSFRLNYGGISNINTTYGTRNITFFSEGIEVASGASNTGNYKNSGVRVNGSTAYVDLFSSKSVSTTDYSTRLVAETNGNFGVLNPKGLVYISSPAAINLQPGTSVNINKPLEMGGNNINGANNLIGSTSTGGSKVNMINVQGSGSSAYLNITSGSTSWGVTMWTSDMRLKTNIQKTPDNGLELVDRLMVRSFDWRDSDRHTDYGLIAQNVERVLPQAVFEVPQPQSEAIKQISVEGLVPILVKAIQELKQEINTLKESA